MNSKKWLLALGIIVVILVVAGVIKGMSGGKGKKVAVEKVERRTIIETVAASGKIQPETEVIISSDVSGEIIEMPVQEGDRVKAGDLLLKINPDLVESALSRAEAALNTTKANLAGSKARLAQSESQFQNTKASFERSAQLHESKVISQAEFDQAKANYEVATADVEAAKENVRAGMFNVRSSEATLKEAKENLGRTSIYSPMNGVITKLNKEKGERVVGTAQMAGTEIMTVADLNVMEVAVEVNENDIVRVAINDTTEIEVDAYLDKTFKGIVTEIANSANTSGMSADQVTNFDVKIRMLRYSYEELLKKRADSSSPFRPGMSATVDIRTTQVNNVITVPIQGVTIRTDTLSTSNETAQLEADEEDEKEKVEVVFVRDGEQVKMVKVETGIQNTMYIEILNGLEEGQEIVVAPYTLVSKILKDGQSIIVIDKKDLFTANKK
ncbi:efflux RND transporter periplasmic adaptor subunit [Vicingaceae bacterium]|nr:efflux RND transporter periplasmic adaptor subunit [Vicingaceae bacterium]MDB4060836.1 efflux RND transporter periplasmic adaptor subunit [Vicingaceae bacterium]MDB9963879.1 efflux RND transporter periplasmic adaptor subunit [Vicingaceae bacterium]